MGPPADGMPSHSGMKQNVSVTERASSARTCIVEMHGGSVFASSDGPGSGSQFIVRLPREVGHVRL